MRSAIKFLINNAGGRSGHHRRGARSGLPYGRQRDGPALAGQPAVAGLPDGLVPFCRRSPPTPDGSDGQQPQPPPNSADGAGAASTGEQPDPPSTIEPIIQAVEKGHPRRPGGDLRSMA